MHYLSRRALSRSHPRRGRARKAGRTGQARRDAACPTRRSRTSAGDQLSRPAADDVCRGYPGFQNGGIGVPNRSCNPGISRLCCARWRIDAVNPRPRGRRRRFRPASARRKPRQRLRGPCCRFRSAPSRGSLPQRPRFQPHRSVASQRMDPGTDPSSLQPVSVPSSPSLPSAGAGEVFAVRHGRRSIVAIACFGIRWNIAAVIADTFPVAGPAINCSGIARRGWLEDQHWLKLPGQRWGPSVRRLSQELFRRHH